MSMKSNDSAKDIFERLRDEDDSYIRKVERIQGDSEIKNEENLSFREGNLFKRIDSEEHEDPFERNSKKLGEPSSPTWPKTDMYTEIR